MKRRYILAGSLAFYLLWARGQDKAEPLTVSRTDIEVVYNQYVQDGDNSAVTGGEGTERLTVYGPSFGIGHAFNKNRLDFHLGVDVISSASTDNIDDVVSSASRLDARSYADLSYTRTFADNRIAVNLGASISIESDYFSIGKLLGTTITSEDRLTTYSAQLAIYNDDLRWGRLEGGFLKDPIELIYPVELRFQEWYDEFKRNTYTLNLGMTQVLDQRNTIGAFGIITVQDGLLATPFHRIYFSDGSLAVEQLPDEKLKLGLSAKWNTFVGGSTILRSTVEGYTDDFGILAFALENETAFKVDPRWTIIPNVRFYTQSASKYFARIREHDPNDEFYTSDFDLSQFQSYSVGLAIAHAPLGKNKGATRDFRLRYLFYGRSNQLTTHSMSLVLNLRSKGNPK